MVLKKNADFFKQDTNTIAHLFEDTEEYQSRWILKRKGVWSGIITLKKPVSAPKPADNGCIML